jgi:hypothetical protein
MTEKLSVFELLKWGKRERMVIYPVAVLVVLFVVVKLCVVPMKHKGEADREAIKKLETDLSSALSISQRKDQIVRDASAYKKYIQGLQDASSRETATKFLKEIEKIAQESNVSILSLTPEHAAGTAEDDKILLASLRAEGDAKQFYVFIGKMQESTLLLKLEDFALTAKDEESGALKMDMSISLATL